MKLQHYALVQKIRSLRLRSLLFLTVATIMEKSRSWLFSWIIFGREFPIAVGFVQEINFGSLDLLGCSIFYQTGFESHLCVFVWFCKRLRGECWKRVVIYELDFWTSLTWSDWRNCNSELTASSSNRFPWSAPVCVLTTVIISTSVHFKYY